jgi:DNA-binding PadR family transcriptional regulator
MKLDKVIFCMPKANKLAATRLSLIRPLIASELFILYAIKRLPNPCTHMHIDRFAERVYNPMSFNTIAKALSYLTEQQLIERNLKSYSLSPLGREYLSYIRQYLINVRL